MRVEGSVTAISWIPSEAIEGMPKLPFELGIGHYDEPPPDRLGEGDLARLCDADRFREANQLKAWIEVEDGAIVERATRAAGSSGSTTFRFGPEGDRRPGSGVRGAARRAGGLRRPCPLRADGRRACGLPSAAAGQGRAVVPHQFGDGVDDTRADAPRGRPHRARGRRGEPVPASLDLRRRGRPRGEERHRRLQGVVSQLARRQHAVGRRRVGGGGRGGGERARARAVADASLGRRGARQAKARRGRGARDAGRGGRRALPPPRRRPGRRGRRRAGRRDGAGDDRR